MVAEVYRRFVSGESMRSLAELMNARGFRTAQGNLFSPTGLGRALDTGFAAGLIRERSPEALEKARAKAARQGKSLAQLPKSTLKDFDVWRDGAHTPIIDTGTWEAYKRIRLANAEKAPQKIAGKYAFTGLIFCRGCETGMVSQASVKHGKHNWRCRKAMEYKTCKGTTISNRKVERAVLEWLRREAEGGDSVVEMAERVRDAEVANTQLASLRRELTKLETRRANLIDMRADGHLSREEYQTVGPRLKSRWNQ